MSTFKATPALTSSTSDFIRRDAIQDFVLAPFAPYRVTSSETMIDCGSSFQLVKQYSNSRLLIDLEIGIRSRPCFGCFYCRQRKHLANRVFSPGLKLLHSIRLSDISILAVHIYLKIGVVSHVLSLGLSFAF